MTMTGLDRWYACAKSQGARGLLDLLHPEVVFESPVVHTPQRGRDITYKYLSSALKVLGGPTFAYVGEWRSQDGAVLEFVTEIDGTKINGVDIISFADDGRIKHFKVMVRPLKAINLLHRMMGEELAKTGGNSPRPVRRACQESLMGVLDSRTGLRSVSGTDWIFAIL